MLVASTILVCRALMSGWVIKFVRIQEAGLLITWGIVLLRVLKKRICLLQIVIEGVEIFFSRLLLLALDCEAIVRCFIFKTGCERGILLYLGKRIWFWRIWGLVILCWIYPLSKNIVSFRLKKVGILNLGGRPPICLLWIALEQLNPFVGWGTCLRLKHFFFRWTFYFDWLCFCFLNHRCLSVPCSAAAPAKIILSHISMSLFKFINVNQT